MKKIVGSERTSNSSFKRLRFKWNNSLEFLLDAKSFMGIQNDFVLVDCACSFYVVEIRDRVGTIL